MSVKFIRPKMGLYVASASEAPVPHFSRAVAHAQWADLDKTV
jgi:hypothetical protein